MDNKRVGQSMFSTTNKLKRLINKRLQEFGVSGVQSRTLNYIYRQKGNNEVYQTDIKDFLSIRGSTAAELVKGLIDLGLIERIKSKTDKRKKILELTYKGEKIALETINIFDEIENDLRKGISKQSYNQLIDLLKNIDEIVDLKEKEIDV